MDHRGCNGAVELGAQVSDADDVWTQVTLSLRSQLAESVWFSTFQDLTPLESDADTLRLMAPSAYVRDRILTRYLPLVTEALHDANEGQRNVEIDVAATDGAARRTRRHGQRHVERRSANARRSDTHGSDERQRAGVDSGACSTKPG